MRRPEMDRSPGSDTVKCHSPERFHTVWVVFENSRREDVHVAPLGGGLLREPLPQVTLGQAVRVASSLSFTTSPDLWKSPSSRQTRNIGSLRCREGAPLA
jgi:hypothetical protein